MFVRVSSSFRVLSKNLSVILLLVQTCGKDGSRSGSFAIELQIGVLGTSIRIYVGNTDSSVSS